MNWASIITSVAAALLAGGGGAAVVTAFARRKVTKVEMAERLNDMALEQLEAFKAEAAEARKEVNQARREMAQVRHEMHVIKLDAEELTSYLTQVIRWIHSPDMSMERLRALVSQSGPLKGQAGTTPSR